MTYVVELAESEAELELAGKVLFEIGLRLMHESTNVRRFTWIPAYKDLLHTDSIFGTASVFRATISRSPILPDRRHGPVATFFPRLF